MINSVAESIFGLILIYGLYYAFFSDDLKERLSSFKEKREALSSAEKIAKVKLVSDDPKDIEQFITKNVNALSAGMVNQLVARIEMIKNDKVINADDMLKKRISDLAPPAVEMESAASAPGKRMNGKN